MTMTYPTCEQCEDFDECPLGDACPVNAIADALKNRDAS